MHGAAYSWTPPQGFKASCFVKHRGFTFIFLSELFGNIKGTFRYKKKLPHLNTEDASLQQAETPQLYAMACTTPHAVRWGTYCAYFDVPI
jgi:hypothetical protein